MSLKPPSKNISSSLRGQSPGGRAAEPVSTGRQSAASAAGMVIPGEGGVSAPPGTAPERTVKPYADAVGGHFGSTK